MTKRKRKREYTWYLYTTDANTNEVFARELPEENAHKGVLCSDEEKKAHVDV